MSRQSDPVPALDRSHLLFQILYDDYLTAFLVGESGQTEGIHENLRQSTVKTSPDSMQLLQAFLRKRVPQIKSDEAFKMPPVTIMDTPKAYSFVLDNAGANFPKRDAVDSRVIKTARMGKAIYVKDAPEFVSPYVKRRLPADSYKQGIITDIRQVGGLPEYKGEPYADTDNDGMPDVWEVANGLNPNDPSDAVKDCNGDGYTNIEKYINGIDTKKKVDWTDLKNNHDTLSKRKSLF